MSERLCKPVWKQVGPAQSAAATSTRKLIEVSLYFWVGLFNARFSRRLAPLGRVEMLAEGLDENDSAFKLG